MIYEFTPRFNKRKHHVYGVALAFVINGINLFNSIVIWLQRFLISSFLIIPIFLTTVSIVLASKLLLAAYCESNGKWADALWRLAKIISLDVFKLSILNNLKNAPAAYIENVTLSLAAMFGLCAIRAYVLPDIKCKSLSNFNNLSLWVS